MSEIKQVSYQEFRKDYEDHHPASVPQPEVYIGEYAKWVTWVVGGMFVTAAFFSGVHTVPIAYDAIDSTKVVDWLRQAGGMSAFVFVEAGVLLSAYLLVKRFSIVMCFILLITIAVAMGANLYSVSKALQSVTGDFFTQVITVFFGLVAPLMAALSGGVFVWLHQSDRTADARMQTKLKERQIEWDKEVEKAWKSYQKTGGRETIRPQPSAVSAPDGRTSADTDNQRTATGQGYSKRTDAREVVKAFLEANPDGINGNVRQIAESLNVGKTTVSDVQREMRERTTLATNGHGKKNV